MDDIVLKPPNAPALMGADARPLYPELSDADSEIYQWQHTSAFYVDPARDHSGDGIHRHIVDVLIEERAPRLSASRFWPLLRGALYKVLGYKLGVNLVDTAGRMSATDAFAHASEKMGVNLHATGIEHVPESGGFIMALNHPTGIADGLAAHDLLLQVRPDPIVFVNGDAIRQNPRLTEKLIPVEWHEDKKTRAKSRETLRATKKAFAEGRAVILFPSGRLAYKDKNKTLRERPWMASVAVLARKYNVPLVPAHLSARNSWLFYLLWKTSEELRDMTVFREWFNKRGKTFAFTIQSPIDPGDLLDDNDEAADELRAYVEEGVTNGQSFSEWRLAEKALPA